MSRKDILKHHEKYWKEENCNVLTIFCNKKLVRLLIPFERRIEDYMISWWKFFRWSFARTKSFSTLQYRPWYCRWFSHFVPVFKVCFIPFCKEVDPYFSNKNSITVPESSYAHPSGNKEYFWINFSPDFKVTVFSHNQKFFWNTFINLWILSNY